MSWAVIVQKLDQKGAMQEVNAMKKVRFNGAHQWLLQSLPAVMSMMAAIIRIISVLKYPD